MKLSREQLLIAYKAIDHYYVTIKPAELSGLALSMASLGPPPHEDYEETKALRDALKEELLHPSGEEATDEEDDWEEDEDEDEEDLDQEGPEGAEEASTSAQADLPGDPEEDRREEEEAGPTVAAAEFADVPDLTGEVISSSPIFSVSVGTRVTVSMDVLGDALVIDEADEDNYDSLTPNTVTRTGRTLTLEEAGETLSISIKRFPKAWSSLLAAGITYTVLEEDEKR